MSREVSLKLGPQRAFIKVRLPKGHSSPAAPKIQTALSRMHEEQRLSSGAGCTVFFVRKGAGLKAIQRCEGRKLSTAASRRFAMNKPCIGKQKRFVKCGAGATRARKRRARRK